MALDLLEFNKKKNKNKINKTKFKNKFTRQAQLEFARKKEK